jgi:hypothetical protein
LLLSAPAGADDLLQGKLNDTGKQDPYLVIYLGKVAVGGKKEVYETLQSIKVALEQPLSNDPKLADVMVCRLSDDIGSHAKQLLVCATNRTLNQNREVLQTAMDSTLADTDPPAGGDSSKGSSTACISGSCYENTVNLLNETINNQPHHYLKQQVNGASLRGLLNTIPYPKQEAPAASTVVAPPAVTGHV